ncbi:ROK family protein [Kitasatospora kifunensis]|uniref:Kanosamine 6-kinase n=1 Tax=Kitasatospora kifunensis TaxID=58351 RepID=A0A7W7R7T2_KITKI|nr:ROK family protein [Kitasatospora kifunensis]MBB4926870.1 kanosamine 6-kinase [Kitasatospora kifunensis]
MRTRDEAPREALGEAASPAPRYLGIDIGGTKVALRAETEAGQAQELSFAWGPRHDADRDLAQLADHVRTLTARSGKPWRAVGVALPATVGPDERITAWPSRPEWTGLPLGPALRALFPGAALAWADDGDVGALAEADAANCADLLYLGVGTGVGGGLVLGGRLCPGPGRGSFELGHLVVELDGPPCVCGRRGCLQATASGPATLARAARLRGGPVSFEELREGLRAGRPWAAEAIDRTGYALAAAITGVTELLHPQLALIGGGFAAGIPELADRVGEHLTALARPGRPSLPLAPARLGGLSSLRGAVLLARGTASRF